MPSKKPKALGNPIASSKNIVNLQATPSKIDPPDYPDRGVRWDKYAKDFISGNEFKLIRQGCYLYGFQLAIAAGIDQPLPIVNAQERITYLTDLEFQFTGATVGDLFTMIIPGEQAFVPVQLAIVMKAASDVYKYELKAPLRISQQINPLLGYPVILVSSTNGATITYNFFGFYEE